MNRRLLRATSCGSLHVGWWLAGWTVLATGAFACGPWLPEQILITPQTALRTPVGELAQEVAALDGPGDAAPALPPGTEYVQNPTLARVWQDDSKEHPQNQLSIEGIEFTAILDRRGLPKEKQDTLLAAYMAYRLAAGTHPPDSTLGVDNNGDDDLHATPTPAADPATVPPQKLPADLAAVLPADWVDYLQGADCYHAGDEEGARQCWERLLARPPAERLDRAVWAAFMLARMLDGSGSPAENTARYQRVRELRAAGCADQIGLAAASLGWEARSAYQRGDFSQAARLYYLQARAGTLDGDSLEQVAKAALGEGKEGDPTLLASAHDPFLRRVETLYLACSRSFSDEWDERPVVPADPTSPPEFAPDPNTGATEIPKNPNADRLRSWLTALKSVEVDNLHEVAAVAWAAYQRGTYDQAADWLKLAPAEDPLALWLRAKLALRAGKDDEAARDFARAVHAYPADRAIRNEVAPDSQRAEDSRRFRSQQFQMDWGIVQLSRGDFKQALDALLRSGFWYDAAYVAEQVLTLDELDRYVRGNYPAAPAARVPALEREKSAADSDADQEEKSDPERALDKLRGELSRGIDEELSANPTAFALRYLLARRLGRAGRYAEARPYYPAVLWKKLDEYVAARKTGEDGTAPKTKRADAYWRAAKLERYLGMELFGTEDAPDWYVLGGSYELDTYGDTRLGRSSPLSSQWGRYESNSPPPYVPPVGAGEKQRLAKVETQPFVRYHYRPLAADLAWKAAALMPDQQEETARVLAFGGHWLESIQETKEADRFYTAILRRCNRTALGREADQSGKIPDLPQEPF